MERDLELRALQLAEHAGGLGVHPGACGHPGDDRLADSRVLVGRYRRIRKRPLLREPRVRKREVHLRSRGHGSHDDGHGLDERRLQQLPAPRHHSLGAALQRRVPRHVPDASRRNAARAALGRERAENARRAAIVEPESARDLARWGKSSTLFATQMANLRGFISGRAARMQNEAIAFFGVSAEDAAKYFG